MERFDVVLDKGCADTFQFRGRTNETPRLLAMLFKSVASVLKPGGKLIIVTPKRRIKVSQVRPVWVVSLTQTLHSDPPPLAMARG